MKSPPPPPSCPSVWYLYKTWGHWWQGMTGHGRAWQAVSQASSPAGTIGSTQLPDLHVTNMDILNCMNCPECQEWIALTFLKKCLTPELSEITKAPWKPGIAVLPWQLPSLRLTSWNFREFLVWLDWMDCKDCQNIKEFQVWQIEWIVRTVRIFSNFRSDWTEWISRTVRPSWIT